jgi:Subtilase family
MNWTIRCFARQCSDCAPDAWRKFLSVLTCAAILSAANCCALAIADDLATSDLYLNAGSGTVQGPISASGTYDLNTLLGADRFFNDGLTGTNAVMANIEAGYIWNGHETLTHVGYIPLSNGALGEFDRHATWVGSVMGGRPGGANPGEYQRGMAPDAQLDSGAIATSWVNNNSSYPRYTTSFYANFSGISTFGPYRAAFISGVPAPSGSRPADVVNSSWVTASGGSQAGTDNLSGTLDALIDQNPHTLLTLAAGNSGAGNNHVAAPASCYNALTVAALDPDGGAFDVPSSFSSGGPDDYSDPVHGTVTAARQVVDIAAPGRSFATAYYGGQTGGNGPNVYGPANGPAGGPDWYSRSVSGTSFAAPTVAGGAALLYDAAYARLGSDPNARDARVMKAVLMNSADKTLGWNNGQTPNPNGFGGVITTQGLDNRVGAGRMDLNRAYDQFLSGTTDVAGTLQGSMGSVKRTGWDFGQVAEGITNDYRINSPLQAGSSFAATLTWFRDRQTFGSTSYTDVSFDNLDLELWSDVAGTPTNLISTSDSLYNNTEHFFFTIPTTGEYTLRVRWTGELFDNVGDPNIEQYGLAWATTLASVPEPSSLVLLIALIPWGLGRRFRH